jgi:Tfp pilus assembly protein PilV
MTTHCTAQNRRGFSLIEVVLAIGIFLVTVLALVGLLGPTLQSVDEVEKTDEVSSVVNTVNAFLQSSSDIAATGQSKFESIYAAVKSNNFATIFEPFWATFYTWFL